MQSREIVAAMKYMAELHLISLFCFWCESRKHLKIQEKQHLKHQQEPSVQKLPKVGLGQKSIARSSFKLGHLCFNPDSLWQSSAQKCAPKVTRTDFIHHLWSFFRYCISGIQKSKIILISFSVLAAFQLMWGTQSFKTLSTHSAPVSAASLINSRDWFHWNYLSP